MSQLRPEEQERDDDQLSKEQEDQIFEGYRQQKDRDEVVGKITSSFIYALPAMIISALFLYFSIRCHQEGCVHLKFIAELIGYCFLISVLLRFLVYAPLVLAFKEKNAKTLLAVYESHGCAETVIQGFLFLALIYTFFEDEACGSLHTFVEVYFIIILSLVTLAVCICTCCGIGYLASTSSLSARTIV